jgi:hypothetical protein
VGFAHRYLRFAFFWWARPTLLDALLPEDNTLFLAHVKGIGMTLVGIAPFFADFSGRGVRSGGQGDKV